MITIWQWEGAATTVANPSTSPPSPPNAILAQGNFGSRPFWLKASLAQGHQMVALVVVVMAMVALMVIVMNDVGDGDYGHDEHGGRH